MLSIFKEIESIRAFLFWNKIFSMDEIINRNIEVLGKPYQRIQIGASFAVFIV
jgi:hypothetical protein